jgi:hypothetical protein
MWTEFPNGTMQTYPNLQFYPTYYSFLTHPGASQEKKFKSDKCLERPVDNRNTLNVQNTALSARRRVHGRCRSKQGKQEI